MLLLHLLLLLLGHLNLLELLGLEHDLLTTVCSRLDELKQLLPWLLAERGLRVVRGRLARLLLLLLRLLLGLLLRVSTIGWCNYLSRLLLRWSRLELPRDHALVLRHVEELLVLLRQNLRAVLGRHLDLIVRLWVLVVNRDRLGWRQVRGRVGCLACLWVQTEGLRHVRGRWQRLRRVCSLVVLLLLLLGLLLRELQPLLEDLHHVVTLLLFVDQLLVEDLVDVCDWLLNLVQHLFKLAFQLWHDLGHHRLFELVMDDLAHRLIRQSRGGACSDSSSRR